MKSLHVSQSSEKCLDINNDALFHDLESVMSQSLSNDTIYLIDELKVNSPITEISFFHSSSKEGKARILNSDIFASTRLFFYLTLQLTKSLALLPEYPHQRNEY